MPPVNCTVWRRYTFVITLTRVLVLLGSRVLAEHHATSSAEPNWLIVISIPEVCPPPVEKACPPPVKNLERFPLERKHVRLPRQACLPPKTDDRYCMIIFWKLCSLLRDFLLEIASFGCRISPGLFRPRPCILRVFYGSCLL